MLSESILAFSVYLRLSFAFSDRSSNPGTDRYSRLTHYLCFVYFSGMGKLESRKEEGLPGPLAFAIGAKCKP